MASFKSEQTEKSAARLTSELMAASARTAPKARGVDAVETLVLDGSDLEELAAAMEREAENRPAYLSATFQRDAGNVRNSICVLLLGVKGDPKKIEQPIDCGACGYDNCEQLAAAEKKTRDFTGPNCVFQALDLGIALGSAAKIAGELSIDNRMMYTVGVAAKRLQLLDSDMVIGIPLSVSGKSPYFDR